MVYIYIDRGYTEGNDRLHVHVRIECMFPGNMYTHTHNAHTIVYTHMHARTHATRAHTHTHTYVSKNMYIRVH